MAQACLRAPPVVADEAKLAIVFTTSAGVRLTLIIWTRQKKLSPYSMTGKLKSFISRRKSGSVWNAWNILQAMLSSIMQIIVKKIHRHHLGENLKIYVFIARYDLYKN